MKLLTCSSSPHIRNNDGTRNLMLDVVIALIPILFAACYFFGMRALTLTLVAVGSAVIFEYLYRKILKKPTSVNDFSAVITGMLLAYNLPVSAPLWLPVVGSFFAIVIVKQLYGGLGMNFVNPALAGRAFLLSWPGMMTNFTKPFEYFSATAINVDAVSSATPLSFIKNGTAPGASIFDALIGNIGGSMGETTALLIIAGGLYLIFRKTITWHIPVSYLAVVAVISFVFPRLDGRLDSMLFELFTGGVMLGAVFMATDYVTSPVTPRGRIIFGIGCGLLTMFIRHFGGYNEGVTFSILIMNCCAWLIDKIGHPKRYGEVG